MSKVQTRRTISVARPLWEAIHRQAAREGISAAHWLGELARRRLKMPARKAYPNSNGNRGRRRPRIATHEQTHKPRHVLASLGWPFA